MTIDEPTGGCQCGAVRYRLKVQPPTVYACHCRECQKQTSSAFSISVPLQARDIEVTGALAAFERRAESGATTRCLFCPACGTRVYHQSSRAPDRLTLKAGTLDDTSALRPAAHLWISRKQPWVILPEGAPAFETQPDDVSAWRAGLGKV